MTDISAIIRSLGKLFGLINLYSADHPIIVQALNNTFDNVRQYLSANPELTIGTAEHKLVVGDKTVDEIGLLGSEIIDIFDKAGIDTITFLSGVTKDDIKNLVRVIASKEPEVERLLAESGVVNIRVNTVQYARIKDGETIASEAGKGDAEWINDLHGNGLEAMIWKVIAKAVKSPEDQKRVFSIIMEHLKKDIEEKVKIATMTLEMEKRQISHDKERTEMVMSRSSAGMVMVDDNGRILMMNDEAEKIFSKGLKDKAGRHITEGLGDEHMVVLSKDLSSVVGEDLEKEVELKGSDETKRVLKSSTALVHNIEGKVVGMISVLSDITKQRELDRLKKDFVTHVTHELRTPLVAVKQAVTLLVDKTAGSVSEQQEKMLQLIKRNIERLSKFINDLLDIQKIEAGRLAVHQEQANFRNIVNDVIQSLTPWAESQGVGFFTKVPDEIPDIYADGDRVIQILTNLVGNAVKFTGKGGRVSVNVSPPGSGNDTNKFLKCSVVDNGCGISRDDLDRIFEKFEQVGGRNATDIKGSGLGLSIVKSLVEMHGGKVWVESQVGVGSKFTFTLPLYTGSSDEYPERDDKGIFEEQKKGLLQRLGLSYSLSPKGRGIG